MKKSILGFVATIFAISCLFFTSCGRQEVSIEIVNKTNVDLNVESVDIYEDTWDGYTTEIVNDSGWYHSVSASHTDNIKEGTTISSNSSATITVDFNSTADYNFIKLNCSYQTTSGTTAYPYIGILNGDEVTTYTDYKTTDGMLFASSSPILNFVKTDDDNYVLCLVK